MCPREKEIAKVKVKAKVKVCVREREREVGKVGTGVEKGRSKFIRFLFTTFSSNSLLAAI